MLSIEKEEEKKDVERGRKREGEKAVYDRHADAQD